MFSVNTSSEMGELLKTQEKVSVKFSSNTNILLKDTAVPRDIEREIEVYANSKRRSLHCSRFTPTCTEADGFIFTE